MTDIVQIALISAGCSVAVSMIPGLMIAINAHRAMKASEYGAEIAKETAKAVDGRMTEMLELTRKLAYKVGMSDQKTLGDELAAAVKAAQAPTVVIAQPMPPAVQRQENDAKT
jgi:hypothetical protein